MSNLMIKTTSDATNIRSAVFDAITLAKKLDFSVELFFNGTTIKIDPTSSVNDACERWKSMHDLFGCFA